MKADYGIQWNRRRGQRTPQGPQRLKTVPAPLNRKFHNPALGHVECISVNISKTHQNRNVEWEEARFKGTYTHWCFILVVYRTFQVILYVVGTHWYTGTTFEKKHKEEGFWGLLEHEGWGMSRREHIDQHLPAPPNHVGTLVNTVTVHLSCSVI